MGLYEIKRMKTRIFIPYPSPEAHDLAMRENLQRKANVDKHIARLGLLRYKISGPIRYNNDALWQEFIQMICLIHREGLWAELYKEIKPIAKELAIKEW